MAATATVARDRDLVCVDMSLTFGTIAEMLETACGKVDQPHTYTAS